MCVIAVCKKRFPTLKELKKMEKANPDGGSIAYHIAEQIYWKKGLTAKEIYSHNKKAKFPIIIHFRIATTNKVCKELYHPFPTTHFPDRKKLSGLDLAVLFHNKTIKKWKAIKKQYNLNGEMDTKVMADFVAIKGEKVLDLFPENRFVYFSGKKLKLVGDWFERKGILYSNMRWPTLFHRFLWMIKFNFLTRVKI